MQHILPENALKQIARSFKDGIALAESGYMYGREDEDVLTGALGQSLIARGYIQINDLVLEWNTTYNKFRGRGKNATEKILGADGIFQIELKNEIGECLLKKGLLFQAKNNWEGTDKRLYDQAKLLSFLEQLAIVINYSAQGYEAFSANAVSDAHGNRKLIKPDQTRKLAEVLGDEFVYCKTGLVDVWYDIHSKKLHMPFPLYPKKIAYRHIITTSITKKDKEKI